MAETTRLSVGKALDKLRRPDVQKTKMNIFDDKIDALNDDIAHMKEMRHRLERDQRAKTTKQD